MLGDEVYGNGCASGWNSTSGPMCWRSRRRCGRWSGGDPGAGQGSAEPREGWRRLSAGAKGERLYDWARFRLFRLQQAPTGCWCAARSPSRTRWHITSCSARPPPAWRPDRRWPVEECFETAKQEVGLDGYEVRSWHGWYRHITLSMLALAFLAAMRVELASQKGAEDPAHSLPSACPRFVASSPASS